MPSTRSLEIDSRSSRVDEKPHRQPILRLVRHFHGLFTDNPQPSVPPSSDFQRPPWRRVHHCRHSRQFKLGSGKTGVDTQRRHRLWYPWNRLFCIHAFCDTLPGNIHGHAVPGCKGLFGNDNQSSHEPEILNDKHLCPHCADVHIAASFYDSTPRISQIAISAGVFEIVARTDIVLCFVSLAGHTHGIFRNPFRLNHGCCISGSCMSLLLEKCGYAITICNACFP